MSFAFTVAYTFRSLAVILNTRRKRLPNFLLKTKPEGSTSPNDTLAMDCMDTGATDANAQTLELEDGGHERYIWYSRRATPSINKQKHPAEKTLRHHSNEHLALNTTGRAIKCYRVITASPLHPLALPCVKHVHRPGNPYAPLVLDPYPP